MDRRRTPSEVVLLACCALALAGCAKKPGGQVVAVVNGREITKQEVAAEAAAERVPADTDMAKAGPQIVQRIIDRSLLADVGRENGLDRSPEYLARRRQMEDGLLASLAMSDMAAKEATPSPSEIKSYIDANPTLFRSRQRITLDQVEFATPSDANELLRIRNLPDMAAVKAYLHGKGIPIGTRTVTVDTGTIDPGLGMQIVRMRDGEIFHLAAGAVTFVSEITSRSDAATAPGSWPEQASAALKQQKLSRSVQARLDQLRKSAKIEYADGFATQRP